MNAMGAPYSARRTPIVAGNWKMHYGPREAREFAATIIGDLAALTGVERVLCPPAISLTAVHAVINGTGVRLGAQNMYVEPQGAYTGEIAPTMLQGLCEYVIVGHSERRAYFGETDAFVNRKALAAFAYGLKPIVCVGELLADRDANLTERVISTQVRGSLANLPAEHMRDLVIAYEPVWAIGTGRAATAQDAADVIAIIRALVGELYGADAARVVRIQYGGSVTTANARELAAIEDIDGALVGGASLKADFVTIAQRFAEAKAGR